MGVYIGLILFGILGAIIAFGFGSKEVKAAIVAGIAAPAIVTNVISGVQDSRLDANVVAEETAIVTFLATEAHAQTTSHGTTAEAEPSRSITITPVITSGSANVRAPLEYYYIPEGGRVNNGADGAQPVDGTITINGAQTITIPNDAASLVIGGQVIPVEDLDTSGNAVKLQIQTRPTVGGDLIWALGGSRKYAVTGVQVVP